MKSILITGANGGIGLACAAAFLADDPEARLFLGCRENRQSAETLAASHPGRVDLLTLNVTDAASWSAAIAAVLAATGRVDVLVNNAGNHRDSLLATMAVEDWHSVIATNLTGTFLGCQAVIKAMMSQRFGRIINIASLSALLAPAGQTNYAAAKAGVVALTQSLAKETARAGITVNAVCPGYIKTEALGSDPAVLAELAKRIPARRLGLPEEIAATVLHLASSAAAYLTGSIIKIDGGIY
jgi:3-oxoacyl-[acyl-carrier protein] reductase